MGKDSDLTVLHFASGDLWAGGEVQLFTLAKTLHTTSDVSVIVVLLNHGVLERKLLDSGVKVIVLDEAKLNSFQILRLLIQTIRAQRPDVVHTHRAKENILGSIAALLAGGIPSLRTAHGSPKHGLDLQQFPQRFTSFLNSLCGRFLQQRIVAVSEDLAGILQNGLPTAKIRVIENGLDLEEIGNHQIARGSAPIRKDDTFKVGLAGRLVAIKRVDLFIQTARYFLDNCPGLKSSFHVFGDGPLNGELKKLSSTLKTEDIVHFEGHCNAIFGRLQDLDVLVMTSDHEGLPMVLLEAMALQTPIVAHAVGGIPKLLDQGSCGVLVHEHSASGYAKELCRLARSPSTLSEISQKALKRVTTNYSAEQNARAYLSEYSTIRKHRVAASKSTGSNLP